MEFRTNPYDENGKVFIPAETEREDIPANTQVEKLAAAQAGGEWKASGGWHGTGDSDEVYIEVKRVK